MAELFPPSGTDTIDQLKAVQHLADRNFSDIDKKLKYVQRATAAIGLRALLEHQFMIEADAAFGAHLDASPKTLMRFNQGLMFIGMLELPRYLYDEDVPLDSLTLDFVHPEVFGVSQDDAPAFHRLRLSVPVLAINTCISTDRIPDLG